MKSQERLAEYKAALDAFEVATQTLAARMLTQSAPTSEEVLAEEHARHRLSKARDRMLPDCPGPQGRRGQRQSASVRSQNYR